MSSADERGEAIWQISRDVDLLSGADEGERFCHVINVERSQHSHRGTTKS